MRQGRGGGCASLHFDGKDSAKPHGVRGRNAGWGGALEEGSKTSSQRLLRHAGPVTEAARGRTALFPRTPSPALWFGANALPGLGEDQVPWAVRCWGVDSVDESGGPGLGERWGAGEGAGARRPWDGLTGAGQEERWVTGGGGPSAPRGHWRCRAPCWREHGEEQRWGAVRGSGWGAFPGLRLPAAVGRRSHGTEAQGCAAAVTSRWACAREPPHPPHPLLGFKKSQKQHTRETRTQARGNERQTPRPRPPQRRCPGAAAGKDRQRRRLLPGNAAREHAHTWGPLFKSKR